jgi:carnitine 3-dehydrogenase
MHSIVGDPDMIERITCVGSGLIGHSWATLFAMKGYSVTIQDVDKKLLREAIKRVQSNLRLLAEEQVIPEPSIKEALGRISATTSLVDSVRDADYVQESVTERYEVKKPIFKEMDRHAPEGTPLVSSSSGLLMTEIQKATERPERCVTAHPFNPPHIVPLVEIVPGEETSRKTIEIVRDFMERIGKTPVILKKEVPGYLANRLSAALWREAVDLLDRGVASAEDIDKAISYGPGIRWSIMGPYLTYHLGGGPGGIESYLKQFAPAVTDWLRDMNTWTSIPETAFPKIIKGVREMTTLQKRSIGEVVEWRDRKLIRILRTIQER